MCKFPYNYKGVEYNACLPPSSTSLFFGATPQCPTEVDAIKNAREDSWQNCKSNCPVVSILYAPYEPPNLTNYNCCPSTGGRCLDNDMDGDRHSSCAPCPRHRQQNTGLGFNGAQMIYYLILRHVQTTKICLKSLLIKASRIKIYDRCVKSARH